LEALVVDWGGVLTPPLDAAIAAWARRDHIDFDHFRDVMRRWVGSPREGEPVLSGDDTAAGGTGPSDDIVAQVEQAPDKGPAGDSPVHALERGELAVGAFEHLLADELAARGSSVRAQGLVERMFADFDELSESMVGLVRRARAAGLRTALLSNSWGSGHYPDALFDGLFDAIVISGRVGMRKPEERIYRHTADLLDLPTSACVLVDDLPHNIHGAAATGMVGVLHSDYETTLHELEVLFERSFR
jgi:putative hydrolase of the HAD superfamily